MSIKTRLSELEKISQKIPKTFVLSEVELNRVLTGGDGSIKFGTLTETEVKAFIHGRDMRELTDDELTYIIFGKTSEVAL